MTGSPDMLKCHERYEELSILDSEIINPQTYLIIPEGVGSQPSLQKLLDSYIELAQRNPPAWNTYIGQDIKVKAYELLAQECPSLCVWRGGDFLTEGKNYTFQLSYAVGWTYGTFDGERIHPVLIGVPLKEIVEAYKQEKIIIGGSGLSVGDVEIIPYLQPVDMNRLFRRQIFRIPNHKTPNEQHAWLSAFKNETGRKSGNTHIDFLNTLVKERLSRY